MLYHARQHHVKVGQVTKYAVALLLFKYSIVEAAK